MSQPKIPPREQPRCNNEFIEGVWRERYNGKEFSVKVQVHSTISENQPLRFGYSIVIQGSYLLSKRTPVYIHGYYDQAKTALIEGIAHAKEIIDTKL